MPNTYTAYYSSPLGTLEITGSDAGIAALSFTEAEIPVKQQINPCLGECIKQLDEYFGGKRKAFDLKLDLQGTEFQKKVWKALMDIPFGRTASYGAIAVVVENPKAMRAVGGANNKNKIAIIIPCHRVIGSGGAMTGYAGGLWRKEWLLGHEAGIISAIP